MTESLTGRAQLGFDLGEASPGQGYLPDVDEVRRELFEMLSEARRAPHERSIDAATLKYNSTVFPQMARWLPDEERDQLCRQFEHERVRLEDRLAAGTA